VETAITPCTGWHCSHLFYAFDRGRLAALSAAGRAEGVSRFAAALDPAGPEAATRLQTWIVPGHKADFGVMVLDPDPLKVKNKLMAGCVSFSDFNKVNNVTIGQAIKRRFGVGSGACLFGFSFERASAVNIGGLSSNNARVLSIELNNMTAATNFQCIASVCYLQVANVSNENVVINK
jgi:hypothetical protein